MKRIWASKIVLSMGIALFLAISLITASASEVKAGRPEAKPVVDGLAEGYGMDAVTAGKAAVSIAIWQDRIFIHVKTKATGWVSIAFNRQGKGMDGGNMIFGYLDSSGKAAVRNDLGRGWSHSATAKQDVSEFAFKVVDGEASFEFSYPLAFASGYGIKGLEAGTVYTMLVACNERSNSLTAKHSWYAKIDFSI